ncbi:MAG TPA: Hpt domain-containing protein, partial [Rubrivivax sp.]|nr:Hpt domain-containing protein [Rubrivivax sp.]
LPPAGDDLARPDVQIDLSEVDVEPPPTDAGLVSQGTSSACTPVSDWQTMPLAARIPDLPSAADLELGAPALPEGSPGPASSLPGAHFDLDLSGRAAYAQADAAPQPPQWPQAEASADEADLPLDFAPALPAAPAPAFEFGRDAEPSGPQPLPEWPAFEFDLHEPGQAEEGTHEPAQALAVEPMPEPLSVEPMPELLAVEPMPDSPPFEAAFEHAPLEPARQGVLGEPTIESAATEPTLESVPLPDAPFESAGAEASAALEDEQIKVVGPLRIAIPLFNIYLNEADELSRCLLAEIGEWSVDALHHPVPEAAEALAHKLAGSSATVGYADLSNLARSLEHALGRSRAAGPGREGEAELFGDASEEIRRLLHQFAAGFLRPAPAALLERLADHERWPAASDAAQAPPSAFASLSTPMPLAGAVSLSAFTPLADSPAASASAPAQAFDDDEDIDAVDAVDAELFPIFEDEAAELLPQLQARLREWHDHPGERGAASACMRTLHTFKGGARLAGAMRLGEMAHRLETAVEHLAAHDEIAAAQIEPLLARCDN